MKKICVRVLALWLTAACSQPAAQSATLTGTSPTLAVSGEYASIALPRVDAIALDKGRLLVRGGSDSVTIDPPASADASQPNRRWTLVTESASAGNRVVTFTHETSLEEFSIELPESEAELHYGALASKAGGDVLIFAWGSDSRSYWGYVTIAKK